MPRLIQLTAQSPERDDSLLATLAWNAEELLELFPFEHELILSATARDDALTIAVTVRATGSDPVPVSFGFHPYVRIPGSNRTTWRLEPVGSSSSATARCGPPTPTTLRPACRPR